MEDGVPTHIKKAVIVAAPHTSNWDFYYGRLFFWAAKLPVSMLIKKELFWWPLGPILRAMGGIPVDRSKGGNLVDTIAQMFNERDELIVMFTPEGTRKHVDVWKRGFYHVALKANVPILLGYIDYEKKLGGIGPVFEPTQDAEKDMKEIMSFYYDKIGKYPEQGVTPPATEPV